jgi:hypothetical protein
MMWGSPQVAGYVFLLGVCLFLVFGQLYSVKLRFPRSPFKVAGLSSSERASIQALINKGELPEDPARKSLAVAFIAWNATTAAPAFWLTIPMGIGFQMILYGLYATVVPPGFVIAVQCVVLVLQVSMFALYVRGSRKTTELYRPNPSLDGVGRGES